MPLLGLIFLRYAYSRFIFVEADILKTDLFVTAGLCLLKRMILKQKVQFPCLQRHGMTIQNAGRLPFGLTRVNKNKKFSKGNRIVTDEELENGNSKKDYSFMCVEVAFAVMKYWGIDLLADKPYFNIDKVFKIGNENKYNGLDFLNKRVQKRNNGDLYYNSRYDDFYGTRNYVRRDDIWGVILSSYRYAVGYTHDILTSCDKYPNYGIRNYCVEYRDLLYVIS